MKGEPDTPRYGVPPTVSAVVYAAGRSQRYAKDNH